jgi:hypothetical protein
MNDLPEEWGDAGRDMYFSVYQFMSRFQGVTKHPEAPLLPVEWWGTVAHNAAFLAGSVAEGENLMVVDGDDVLASADLGVAH